MRPILQHPTLPSLIVTNCATPGTRDYAAYCFIPVKMAPSTKIFSLEGRGLKLDTAEQLEPLIADLRAMDDIEEVHMLGNTLGVGACRLLGEVLSLIHI